MQSLIDSITENDTLRAERVNDDALSRLTLDELEQHYRRARLRLLNAQDEKTWAMAEFIAARTVLHHTLEAIWPDPSDGQEADRLF